MIVVDASLAAKWFLNEDDSERARGLLRQNKGQLCGPDLLAIEVSSALVAAANARRMHAFSARAMITFWLETISVEALTLHVVTSRLIGRGVDVAIAIGHPLADCIYLALAIDLGCELVTCDAKFHTKAASAHPRVRLLADFS